MASRSADYRKRKGLTQVALPWDADTWTFVMRETGAITKRAAVECLLRRSVDAHRREQETKAECARARADALARLGATNEF